MATNDGTTRSTDGSYWIQAWFIAADRLGASLDGSGLTVKRMASSGQGTTNPTPVGGANHRLDPGVPTTTDLKETDTVAMENLQLPFTASAAPATFEDL